MKTNNELQTNPVELAKPLQILYILLLTVLILIPGVLFLLIRGHMDTGNYEERSLSPLPYSQEAKDAGLVTTLETFPTQFEA